MSNEVNELIAQAATLALASDFGGESEQINRRILDLAPSDIGSKTRLAKCLLARGDLIQAEAIYQDVLEIDAENTIARNGLNALRAKKADSGPDAARRSRDARSARTRPPRSKPLWRPRKIDVVIAAEDVMRFGEDIKQPWYGARERDYKVAVHIVMAALLSPASCDSEKLPALIADVFGSTKPDLVGLGLNEDAQRQAAECMENPGGLRGALTNLCGGRYGSRQFAWIPDAIQEGFGASVAEAFRKVVDESQPLANRVDDFRSDLTAIAQAFGRTGSALSLGDSQISLAFAAAVLGGFDPTQYTFYMAGSLQRGYDYYAPRLEWPKGCSLGELYEDVCGFVKSIEQELRERGVPVQDLIDAQSFMWLRFRPYVGA